MTQLPSLPLEEWKDTYATLHMWLQIVGKIRLKLTPRVNHWWNSALYVTPRGLHTSTIHLESPGGPLAFDIEFDFLNHALKVVASDGRSRAMALAPKSVADFYSELMGLLGSLGIRVEIDPMPKEVPNPVPHDIDDVHSSYDPEFANRHWRILLEAERILSRFRAEFIGKCSPVHFFWGSFDLAVTRFSGRIAPPRPSADSITREAYSHEVISHGFWPGSGNITGPAFYAYAAPEPEGFKTSKILPSESFYNEPTHGFVLMYEDVRRAADPERMVLDFCRSTYDAAADLAVWDRQSLERHPREFLRKAA
jgi:hypothetical protein